MADPDAVDARRLGRSAFVAGVGDGVVAVALPLLAAGLTRDPLAVAGVVAAQQLPWVLLALALPALRGTDRRTLAGAGGSLRALAVAFAGMTAVVGDETILTLQLVALAVGVAQALGDDAERVGGDALPDRRGSSAHGSLAGAGMLGLGLIGLPLGGLLYELLAPIPLLFDVGVFAVAALLVLSVRRPLHAASPAGAETTSVLPRIGPGTAGPTGAAALTSAATGAVTGVLVLLALDDLGLGAPAFGLVLAGLAASALVGAYAAPVVGSRVGARNATVLVLLAAAAALVAAWYLLDPELPILSVVALGLGVGGAMAAGVLLRAQLHRASADGIDEESLRGFHLAVWAASPAGAVLGGVAARELGVDDVLLGAAAACALAAAVSVLAPGSRGAAAHRPQTVTELP